VATCDRLLAELDLGHEALSNRTVLVVDEAGMVGSRKLARLLEHADQAQAKVLLVGDDRQLAPIDAGGGFRALRLRLGASELTENRRQQQAWEREALELVRSEAGVWDRLHALPLAQLRAAGRLDLARAVADGSHVRALKRGPATGPSPVDRGRAGSKHHVLTDATGIPLAVLLTGGNRHDVTQLMPLLDASRQSAGGSGGRGASRACWSPTAAMTSTSTGGYCALAGSAR
jgi:hypothetical protein